MTHDGFKVGDYVIVSHPEIEAYEGYTFKIVALGYNLLGQSLVHVISIATMNMIQPGRACFYPRELSYEDGTRP